MIEVQNVSKRYQFRQVLKDVSFTVKKNEITCLIGINGTGKSTTMKAILGLVPFHKGDVVIDGISIKKKRSANVSFVPDHLTVPLHLTIAQAFQFMNDFYTNWNQERANELLSYFEMDANQKLHTLSRGNAAKVSLMLGLARNTDYVLLDEPFLGIDLFAKEKIRELFSTHFLEGRGILLTTHEIDEVEHLIDRVVILSDGMIAEDFYTETVRIEEGKSVIDKLREVQKG